MDFMTILKEAKDPNTKITVTEEDTEEDTTDYNADVDEETDETPEETEEETEDTDTGEEESEEDTSEESEEEGSGEDEEDEATDYSEQIDDIQPTEGEDTGSEEDTSAETPSDSESSEDDSDKTKIGILLHDFVDLYGNINNNIAKLDKIKSIDMMTQTVLNKAKSNLNTLSDYTHNYIVTIFTNKSYTENLYTYKYIIQLYRICVQMLSKINDFVSDT